MFVDVALDEHGGHVGIQAHSEEHRGQFDGLRSDNSGLFDGGEGMQVDDSVENIAIVLTGDPIDEGTEVISQMDSAGGLDAGQDAGHPAKVADLLAFRRGF